MEVLGYFYVLRIKNIIMIYSFFIVIFCFLHSWNSTSQAGTFGCRLREYPIDQDARWSWIYQWRNSLNSELRRFRGTFGLVNKRILSYLSKQRVFQRFFVLFFNDPIQFMQEYLGFSLIFDFFRSRCFVRKMLIYYERLTFKGFTCWFTWNQSYIKRVQLDHCFK